MAFLQWSQYLSHMLSHGLRCALCHRTFASASSAHHHYRTAHSPHSATDAATESIVKAEYNFDADAVPCISTHARLQVPGECDADILTLREDITLKEPGRVTQGDWEEEEESSVVIVLSHDSDVEICHYSKEGCEDGLPVPTPTDGKGVFVIEEKPEDTDFTTADASAVCVPVAGSC